MCGSGIWSEDSGLTRTVMPSSVGDLRVGENGDPTVMPFILEPQFTQAIDDVL